MEDIICCVCGAIETEDEVFEYSDIIGGYICEDCCPDDDMVEQEDDCTQCEPEEEGWKIKEESDDPLKG